MDKITELTPLQEQQLAEFREEWRRIGLSTDPIEVEPFAEAVTRLYGRLGEDKPEVVVCTSPWNAMEEISKRKGQDRTHYHGTSLWGSLDAYWIAFYLFPHQYLRPMHTDEQMELLNDWAQIAKSAFWWWPFQGLVVVSDRPASIHYDEQGRLHKPDGHAVTFRDGWGISVWHGTNVPHEWLNGGLSAQEALKTENIEQRRAGCEILGWNTVLNELNAVTIDKDSDPMIGELLEVQLPDADRERFLRVFCDTNREFALPVPPEMETARQANAWTYDIPVEAFAPEGRA